MDVAITGASGLIGSALTEALRAAGHRPIAITRATPGPDAIGWDPSAGAIDAGGLEGLDAVVHLAGAGVGDHRWTDAYKREIKESRQQGTTLLATTLAGLDHPPAVLVSGSAIGYYGDRGDQELTESSGSGTGFLPEVCIVWEAATKPAEDAGIRVARIRTGIVLTPRGGALRKQLPLFRFGLGGRFGDGRQWQSWISLDDEVGAIVHLLDADVAGPVNLTAPNPVRNAEFTTTLGAVMGRPTFLPTPSFGPRLVLGKELAQALLHDSARVMPSALLASGYEFAQPDLEGALRTMLGKDARP